MTLRCRLTKPSYGLFCVLVHAFTSSITEAKCELSMRYTLFCSLAIPLYCLFSVLFYTLTQMITHPPRKLSVSLPLLGCFTIPFNHFPVILYDTPPLFIATS